MGELLNQIEAYCKKGAYPFHMPGHKRNVKGVAPFFEPWFERDVTEVPGLDDLHEPEGILKEAQERAAALYGARQSFFLVNGSTAGVLAAISAAVPKNGTILLQRASHRSAYHAVQLRELKVRYLYGRQADCGEAGRIGLGVDLEEVRRAVEADSRIGAVFLTSPSYDGFSSEIAKIAEYLHTKEIPLLVDAAHGAHLGFSEDFPKSALQEGADVVVMSVHKTLPAPTQTALLHLGSTRVPAEKVQRFLSIYQTSSPSYLLMAAIDECVEQVSKWDTAVWQAFYERRKRLSERLHSLKNIGVWDCFGRSRVPEGSEETASSEVPEPGKILIFAPDGKSGVALGEWLAKEGVQCEMALPAYVLLICTVADTEEGYVRLAEALEKADRMPELRKALKECCAGRSEAEECDARQIGDASVRVLREGGLRNDAQALTIAGAAELPEERMALAGAVGRVSAGFVSVYPPGQPILVPGEEITEKKIAELRTLLQQGAAVQGLD